MKTTLTAENAASNNAYKQSILVTATNAVSAQSAVAAVPDSVIAVYAVVYGTSAAGSLTLNSASTAISATLSTPGAGTVAVGNTASNAPLCTTKLGEALTITTTGTASHTATIIYAVLHR